MQAPSHGTEYELVLMVKSASPDAFLERIGSAETVGDYQLVPEGDRRLHDIYFDADDQSLSRHRLNLRLRETNSQWRVTLKKSPGVFSRNRNKRDEMELEWTQDNWSRVSAEISRQGVRLVGAVASRENSPVSMLLAQGLQIIQDRETLRRSRGILSSHGEHLGELAIDSVTYHFSQNDVRLDELEFESKSKKGNSELEQITRTFERTFAPDLERWRMGKLSTGSAIKRALERGQLAGLLTSDGRLKPPVYDLIAKS